MTIRYRDFAIDFIPAREGGLLARVASSPAGEGASIRWAALLLGEEIASVARAAEAKVEAERRGENVDRAELDGPSAVALGAQLFTNLFSGRIRSFFDESLGRLGPSGDGLRIKLQFDLEHTEVAALHGLPWEFLIETEQAYPLGLDLRFSIIRQVPQRRSVEAVPLPCPLRILCASAEPRGYRILSLEDELRRIVKALHQPGKIEVRPLQNATLESIRRELTGPEEFHVLHFMGHGEFDPGSGDGVLYLDNGKGGASIVRGALLADHLRDRTSLRLVFLNACRTARAAAPNPFGGVATSLVRAGIPAVIAMQFPITDGAAATFSETVYRRIAVGDPIDAAVTEGRIAIRTRAPKALEWGTPVLFSHAPSGRLFELAPPTLSDLVPDPPASTPTRPRSWLRLAAGATVALAVGLATWKIPTLYERSNPLTEGKADRPTSVNPAKTKKGSEADADSTERTRKGATQTLGPEEPTSRPHPMSKLTGDDLWAGCPTDIDTFESSIVSLEKGNSRPTIASTPAFPLRQEPQGEFGFIGGEFKMGNQPGSGTQKRCKYCPITARRFRVGAKVRMSSPKGSGGVYFLDEGQSNRGYSLEIDAAGHVFVKRSSGGTFGRTLWQGSITPSQVVELSAEVSPTSIIALVNGRRIAEVPIDPATLSTGPHEVGMILAGDPAEVYFDDFLLTVCE